ncbi:Chitinase, GH18 family [Sinosporangium album]|uniref:Chitinase, GH18 family n=1 Tax=Sinosporangium album TaxID=504805 RepID=A0A1G8GQ54_9ACTN|nr:glycosyl hydrolase family 18 protein [Sinosporangium album]SDH96487.1 Chitinase, GH18 family [Sinosporangium album]
MPDALPPAGTRPSRRAPRRHLAKTLVLILVAGLLEIVLLPTPQAFAAVSDYTVATWNANGKTANVPEAAKIAESRGLDFMALQEMSDAPLPGGVRQDINVDLIKFPPTPSPTPWIMNYSELFVNKKKFFLYRLQHGSANRGVGFISRTKIAASDIKILQLQDDHKGVPPFNAVGAKLGDSWLYSIHATTQRARADNNADLLVENIDTHQDSLSATDPSRANWAIMGDFNRKPTGADDPREKPLEHALTLGPDEKIISQNLATYSKKYNNKRSSSNLDYMVAKGATSTFKATRLNSQHNSDHYPVIFSTSTVDPGTCPAASGSSASAAQNPDCEPPLSRPEAIVSMGDSYISGEAGRWAGNANTSEAGSWKTDRRADCSPAGTDCVYGSTSYDYGGNRCDRSDVAEIKGAYVEDVLAEDQFNIACSGAETEHITTTSFKGERPQVAQLRDIAKDYQVKLIVVSIGGNDLDFSGIIQECGKAYLTGGTPCKTSREQAFASALDTVRDKVVTTLDKIGETMRKEGQAKGSYDLVLQSYPNPIPRAQDNRYPQGPGYSRYSQGGCPFLDVDSDWASTSVVPRISDMLRTAAGMAGATFLDLKEAFAGHEVCAKGAQQATSGTPLTAAKAEWVRWVPYLPGLTDGPHRQGDIQEAVHPNSFGQRVLSDCLTRYVREASSPPLRPAYTCIPVYPYQGDTQVRILPGQQEGLVRIRNVATGEVLDADGTGADAWVITSPNQNKDSQRWMMRNLPEVAGEAAEVSFQALHNKQFLTSNSSKWVFLGGTPRGWSFTPDAYLREGDTLSTGLADPSGTMLTSCLIQDPAEVSQGKKWVSRRLCDSTDPRQKWRVERIETVEPHSMVGDPFDSGDGKLDNGGSRPARPSDHAACRPEGMPPATGARFCDVYQGDGREWLGEGRSRRIIGYFNSGRTGSTDQPSYLVKNIPWYKVTHINYAFAHVDADNRISVGDVGDSRNPATGMTWPGVQGAEIDPALPYQGHFNLLTKYKKQHPRVKTLISVGGWAESRGFYTMATNADGSVNQAGINTFADSVTQFLDRYGFDGVDIDYEYPTALPDSGNPLDWTIANPRRKGLQAGYNALMKTLREKLNTAGTAKSRYYLLTSAASGSGFLVRGLDAGEALKHQDFVNVMTYDLHGSWNHFVGPQAPLYDDGKDNELAAAGIYNDQDPQTKDYQKHGYFNVDWAYHHYRGALPPARINLGLPYYTRGWRDVQGGVNGLWGISTLADQTQCSPGTGGRGGTHPCGAGAVGIDNIWHDKENGKEVPAGSNPLWHAKNLQDGRTPGYMRAYGLDPAQPANQLTGQYQRNYNTELHATSLWNPTKKVFLSVEDEQSIDAKANYITTHGIGGAMIWEMAGDYTRRGNGEWGMGYDLTTRLDTALRNAGPADTSRARGSTAPTTTQAIDVDVDLVEFPTTVADMWPQQPKLRITNNTTVTLGQGTEISFDVPTAAPPIIKDDNYQPISGIRAGHTGPNKGGLKGDFHRVTVTLDYCQDIPRGKALDIPLKYYLPITGPANTVIKINGTSYGTTGSHSRTATRVTPPAPTTAACDAPTWKQGGQYSPTGGRLWAAWDKGTSGWQFEHQGNLMDHHRSANRAHLVTPQGNNANQFWEVKSAGTGLYTIHNAGECLTATTPRTDLAVNACNNSNQQRWKFIPVNPADGTEGSASAPVHGKTFKIRSAAGHDVETAFGGTTTGTRIWTGDLEHSSAAYVSWKGFRWQALWWNQVEPGTAEPNGSHPWRKLGPTP